MEAEINKIKEKIIKLLSIADDESASDNEVYVAVQKAHKLMVTYNINHKDIVDEKEHPKNIESYYFEKMHPRIYIDIANVIANNFRCKLLYHSCRQNVIFILYGYQKDIEIVKEVLEKTFAYLKKHLNQYVKKYKKEFKEQCELLGLGVAKADSRVIKRSYCYGFACGLSNKFEENLLDTKEEYGEETALMAIGVPSEIKDHIQSVVKPKIVNKNNSLKLDRKSFSDGFTVGIHFNV